MKRIILAGFVLVASHVCAWAVDVQEVTSDKGVKALLVEDYTNPLVAVSFSFKGGASQDALGKEGTAKLITTLLDEGAGEIDSETMLAKLEDLGVSYSYTAGMDEFRGSFFTLTSNLDETFGLIGQALSDPRFDAEPISRMKTAALVALKRKEGDAGSKAQDAFREAVYGDHPYGRPADGTAETVGSITREDLEAYHERVFARDNLTVGVVGAISADDLKRKLDELFGALPEKADLRDVPSKAIETGETVHVEFDTPQTVISMVLPGIARDDDDFFAAYLVNYILGGGSFNSRLYEEVREKRGLAYSVYSYLSTRDAANAAVAGTSTRSDRAAESVAIMRDELKRLAKEGVTEAELEAAKRFIKGTYAISNLDTSQKIAGVLVAIQEADLGLDYIDRRASLIEEVTLDDANRIAREIYESDPTIITVGPQKESPALAEAKGG